MYLRFEEYKALSSPVGLSFIQLCEFAYSGRIVLGVIHDA